MKKIAILIGMVVLFSGCILYPARRGPAGPGVGKRPIGKGRPSPGPAVIVIP